MYILTDMTTPGKKYSPAFKAQIVQELFKEESELALSAQETLLQVARSSLYYYKKAEPSERGIKLKGLIDLIYKHFTFYGSRCISFQLGQNDSSPKGG